MPADTALTAGWAYAKHKCVWCGQQMLVRLVDRKQRCPNDCASGLGQCPEQFMPDLPNIVLERGFAWCRTCRGVVSGRCECVMTQDGIDPRDCAAHRTGGHVARCTCVAAPTRDSREQVEPYEFHQDDGCAGLDIVHVTDHPDQHDGYEVRLSGETWAASRDEAEALRREYVHGIRTGKPLPHSPEEDEDEAGACLGFGPDITGERSDPFDPTWTKRPEYEPKTEQAKLGHLVEECNEVIEVMVPLLGHAHDTIQLVGKILRFGWDGTHHEDGRATTQTNRDAMQQILPQVVRESADVRLAAARMLAHLSAAENIPEAAAGGEPAPDATAQAGEVAKDSARAHLRAAEGLDPDQLRAETGWSYERIAEEQAKSHPAFRPSSPNPRAPYVSTKCIDCKNYWGRRGLCTKAVDPADPRENGPGRPWREPETCAPPWCPGFEARNDAPTEEP